MKKIKLKITGMHCTSCSMSIDGELEDTEGIKESNTSYAKQQAEISFNEELIDENKIIQIIKSVGYDAVIA